MAVEWAETKMDLSRDRSVYLTHLMFNSFAGTTWGGTANPVLRILQIISTTKTMW